MGWSGWGAGSSGGGGVCVWFEGAERKEKMSARCDFEKGRRLVAMAHAMGGGMKKHRHGL